MACALTLESQKLSFLALEPCWDSVVASIPLGKEREKEEYLYSAIFADTPLTNRSDMDHTVLPANYTMSHFLRKRSPDDATLTEVADT